MLEKRKNGPITSVRIKAVQTNPQHTLSIPPVSLPSYLRLYEELAVFAINKSEWN